MSKLAITVAQVLLFDTPTEASDASKSVNAGTRVEVLDDQPIVVRPRGVNSSEFRFRKVKVDGVTGYMLEPHLKAVQEPAAPGV